MKIESIDHLETSKSGYSNQIILCKLIPESFIEEQYLKEAQIEAFFDDKQKCIIVNARIPNC